MAPREFALRKPVEVDGKEIASVTLDLDKLTGTDVEMCARLAAAANGHAIDVLILDVGFHAQVASRACGLPVDVLRRMSAADYLALTTAVQGFFLGAG